MAAQHEASNGTPAEDGGSPSKGHFRLRSQPLDHELTADSPRFHIFLIDTRWNQEVSRVLHEHLPLFHHYHPQDPVFILDRAQSVRVLKMAPEHIGRDPIVVVYDAYVPRSRGNDQAKGPENYRGFRLNLGLMRHPEQAVARLQEFLRFIAQHRTATCLDCEVRKQLHREGLANMVTLLREASEASIELL